MRQILEDRDHSVGDLEGSVPMLRVDSIHNGGNWEGSGISTVSVQNIGLDQFECEVLRN